MTERTKANDRYWLPRCTLGELLVMLGLVGGLFVFGLGEREREALVREKLAILTVEVKQVKMEIGEVKFLVRRLEDTISVRFFVPKNPVKE